MKLGPRTLLGVLAVLAVVLFGALGVSACSSTNPPVEGTGGGPGTVGGGGCTTPGPGCACLTPGTAQACGATAASDGGVVTCSEGTMVCGGGGVWGPCVGTAIRERQLAMHPQNLGLDAGSCLDPCDPYCQSISDTPTGLDAGPESGLVVKDGGLTLVVSPAPPPIPCVGLTISPPDASVTITTLDASPLAASQFNAYYVPANCYTGTANALWGVSPGASVATVNSTGTVSVVNPIAGSVGVNAYAGSCVGDGGCPHANLNVNVNVVDTSNEPTGVTPGQLSGATTGSDGLSILYPYNYTVLPLGLLPPTIQWAPAPNGVSAINLTAAGAGYTAPLTVTLTGGGGTGATATATLASAGALTLGTYPPTTPGAGYTSAPTATFNNGGTGVTYTTILATTGALATGSHAASTSGAGYTSPPTATFSNGGTGVTYTTTLATTGALAAATYPVTTAGAGYTSAPTAAFSNGGTGVTYTATLATTGSLASGSHAVTTAGSGYTSPPTATFSNGGTGVTYTTTLATTGALATATYPVTTAGSGYTSAPTLAFSNGGSGVTAVANMTSTTSLMTGTYTVTTRGAGYTGTPTLAFSGGGSGVVYTVTMALPKVTSFTITNGGTGFTSASAVTFSGGGGTTQATYTPTIPVVQTLNSFTVSAGGSGFTGPSAVTFSGGGATTQGTYTPTVPLTYGLASFNVTGGGSGFTGPSAVTFSGGGATTQATYTPTIALTFGLASLTITGGGSGFTGPSSVTFSGGAATTQATYTTPIPLTYGLASFNITGGGSGFTGPSNVTFSGGGATTQATYAPTIPLTYGLASLTITGGGSGFTGPSNVTFSGGGGTTQATYTTPIPLTFGVASVTVTSTGTNYTSPPAVVFAGGTGSGAAATAVLGYTPTATAVKVSLQYPADGSAFTYSEIVPETMSTYDGIALPAPVAAASFPAAVWAAFAQSAVGQNAYMSVQRLVGTQLYPPVTVNISFATNQLKGTVYYNTYGTNYAYNYWPTRGGGYFGGATLAIQPGATTPSPIEGYTSTSSLGGGCRVCHVVSANGNRLITELGNNYNSSQTLSLPTTTWQLAAPNTGEQTMSADFAWAGLSPSASLLFTNGAGLAGASSGASSLYKLTTAASPTAVSVTGLPNVNAGTPAFSADGKHIAFNANGGTGTLTGLSGSGTASPDGVSLGAIDFNGTSTFSNARMIATPGSKGLTAPSGGSDATGKVWFPSFIPDTNADVVFQYETYSNGRDTAGTRSQCDTNGPATCQNEGVHSELWWVPSSSNSTSNRLNCANGISDANCPITTTGTNYLPAHAAYTPQTSFVGGATNPTYGADWNLNYEPTVLPQLVGGYYWMVFTSRRMYGDVATINPFWSDPRYQNIASVPTTKKLWVAAINPNPVAGHDPSYPAFYLDGQELLAGNSRGYLVLNACEAAGTTSASLCTSDLDCCAGETCTLDSPLPTPPTSHCVTNSAVCVADGQTCSAAALCCNPNALCTQGTCQVPPPIPYYTEADFIRTYTNPCAAGFRPIWHAWQYESTTPSDSRLIFVVQTSNSLSSLTSSVDAGGPPVFDGEPVQLPTVVSGAPVTSLAPGQDVETALLNAGQQSGTNLRVITRLMASSDGHVAPTLSAWNQTFDCLPSQ